MSRKSSIINRLDNLLQAKIHCHLMNIEVLLESNVGVAEHPDIMETITKELELVAGFEDTRSCLLKYFSDDKT
tara:strand:- start:14503 stop:14721 length:219 start_codon:yes stop_codon:yes gene_type:complete